MRTAHRWGLWLMLLVLMARTGPDLLTALVFPVGALLFLIPDTERRKTPREHRWLLLGGLGDGAPKRFQCSRCGRVRTPWFPGALGPIWPWPRCKGIESLEEEGHRILAKHDAVRKELTAAGEQRRRILDEHRAFERATLVASLSRDHSLIGLTGDLGSEVRSMVIDRVLSLLDEERERSSTPEVRRG